VHVTAVGIAITPDGKTAYVVGGALHSPGTVTPIQTATGAVGKPIIVGTNLQAIAIIAGGTTWGGMTAYVVNAVPGLRGTVTPIRTPAGTVEQPITVGSFPVAIALPPG